LLPMLPFMALPIIFVFREWGNWWWLRGLAIILFGWSLIATWGLTLAEQAFPPDTVRNPLLEYAWPNWQVGNIARNFGTVLGFPGLWSLMPLMILLTLMGVGWWLLSRRSESSSSSGVSDWTGKPKQISGSGGYAETILD
jgi:hypothetical protein